MIVLFGVVGSGKSEQATRLMARYKIPHISTSKILRDNADPQHQALILAGRLVPDNETLELLEKELKIINAKNNEFILDGAPRSVPQAKWLDQKIKNGELKLTVIIHLQVSKEVVLERLLARGRDDDKEDIIIQRFEQYDNITTPVLEYLKSVGYHIHEIDGEKSPDEVEQQIDTVLDAKK